MDLSFESDDYSLLGMQEILIEAFFLDYPSGIFTTMYGVVEVLESCVDPLFLEVSDQIPLDTDYYSGQVYFKMADWLYYPETCEITFRCDYLDGPRIDQDLCSLPTVSYFDSEYGDWYFDSTDMNEWPPGDYYFWITGTVGVLSEGYELHFHLGNPCDIAFFTFESFPFSDATYELGSPAIVQPWTDADLFSVEMEPGFVPSDCGALVVDFFDVNTNWYFDTYFFSQ